MSSTTSYLGEGPCLAPSTTLALSAAVIFGIYYYYRNLFSYWTRRGVKGPRPWPLVGNLFHVLSNRRRQTLAGWRRQYGEVYGIYEGSKPSLVVADPEVIRQISIKDFDAFPNHDANLPPDKLQSDTLVQLRDDRWRHTRWILSPTFSSGKMRRMYRLMEACVDDLMEAFEEQFVQLKRNEPGPIIQLKDIFSLYTMDAIASCCYGIKLNRQKATTLKAAANRDDFIRMAMRMFNIKFWRLMITMALDNRLLEFLKFKLIPDSDVMPFVNRVGQLIEKRKAEGKTKKFDDYLQILLDAGQPTSECQERESQADKTNFLDSMEEHHAGIKTRGDQKEASRPKDSVRRLDNEVILANAVVLLLVGLETTATLLAHAVYALAFHKTVQDKLREEVAKIAVSKEGKSGPAGHSFQYDSLISCHYLDSVLSETLRALAPVLQTDRRSSREYHIEKYNITLPKGFRVVFDLADVMLNERYWPEPEKFDPERFMPENRDKILPGSYCPFGIGPRHCLGMRFSLTEAKFALAMLIMKFEFVPAPNTSYPPQMSYGLGTIRAPLVRLIRRESQK